MHESTIFACPTPTCVAHPGAILLHDDWTVYDSLSDLPVVCYTPYKIGNPSNPDLHEWAVSNEPRVISEPEVNLTLTPNLCVPQRRNYAKFQISETPSVDSTGIFQRNRLAWTHRRRGLASDGVRYVDARSSVGRLRSVTKLTKVRKGAMGEFSYCCSSAQNTHEKWL